MRIRRTFGALLATTAAVLVATTSPAMAKGGTGGGGGGGGGTTTVPVAGCAQIVSAIDNPNPGPANVNPLPGEPYVTQLGLPPGPSVAFELTVNNQCIDEGGGPRSSLSVTTRSFDTATGALLFTGVNMQPAGMLMDWRSWSLIPAADATAPAQTIVISLVRANGQVQDTLTYTAAEAYQAILTAVAAQTPQPVGHH
jgi:hypothetical protein